MLMGTDDDLKAKLQLMAETEKTILEREQYLEITKEMMKYDTSEEQGYKELKEK